jgi:hypothetical protein
VTLPPVFITFAAAWAVGVAGWSQREFRVEFFSLPLGVALLTAGIVAMYRPVPGPHGWMTWPLGFAGSWPWLAPGLFVIFSASVASTGTDPQTWRAIMVIVLALVAILIGSLRGLAAPFITGIIVLPVENIVVFTVQLGRSISAAPWWITLASAGAVLLVIAMTYERKSTGSKGVVARIRDLT